MSWLFIIFCFYYYDCCYVDLFYYALNSQIILGPGEMEEWMEAISLAMVGNPFHEIIKIKKEVMLRDKKKRRQLVKAVREERREVRKSRREVGKGIMVKDGLGGGEGAASIGLGDIVGIENARSSGSNRSSGSRSSGNRSSGSLSGGPLSGSIPLSISSGSSSGSSSSSSASYSGSSSSGPSVSFSATSSPSQSLSHSSGSLSSLPSSSSPSPLTGSLSTPLSSTSGVKREKFHPF